MSPLINVGIVYEDGHRTEKLLKMLEEEIVRRGLIDLIRLQGLDLDRCNNCIVALPVATPDTRNKEDAINVLLSRFSGSAFYRDNSELQDISMLLLGHQSSAHVSIINDLPVIQLENSKPLQLAKLTSRELSSELSDECRMCIRIPDTVLVRSLTPKALTKAIHEIACGTCLYGTGGAAPAVDNIVLKPAYGGGSRGVFLAEWGQIEKTGANKINDFVVACKATDTISGRPWLVQRCVGKSAEQIRVEVVDSRAIYAVLIKKSDNENTSSSLWREAQNLCLCEVSDDVQLSIHQSPHTLATETGHMQTLCDSLFDYAESVSRFLKAPIMAMEFKIEDDIAYMIDLNLQSNYNLAAEVQQGVVKASSYYLQLFARISMRQPRITGPLKAWVYSRALLKHTLQGLEQMLDVKALCRVDDRQVEKTDFLARLGDLATWSLQYRDSSQDGLEQVGTYACKQSCLVAYANPFTERITQVILGNI